MDRTYISVPGLLSREVGSFLRSLVNGGEDVFVGSRARFREHSETFHQALAARPSPAMEGAWSVSAGSPSFIGATTNALEGAGPGGEGWMNIGREPGFINLPQAPDWTSGATYSA